MTLTIDALRKAGVLRTCFAQSGPEAVDWLATCEDAIRKAVDDSGYDPIFIKEALAAFGLEPK